ncbi:hypothetical protein Tco_0138705 [Tanacetum coccineum]
MLEAKHVQVSFTETVKVSSTNIRLETTVPQKEETFQVVIDRIKNSICFKAFTISTDVLEIFMQQLWKILDICPKVKGKDFTEVQDDDATLSFLINLGYKGPLYKHTNMFVDHMHQPWRTLAAIINKCLSGKTASNDKLRKSKIDILWGMFYRENVDYPNRLKFVRIGEDYQEYGLAIHEVMLNDAIKQSKSYQLFIKYSTESEPEPKLVKRKTAGRRVVKKKVTLSDDDNIITDDPDATLELGKSISLTDAEEAKAVRKVHATHLRIVIEFVHKSAKKKSSGRSSRGVTIQDTPSKPKPKPATSKPKLKGAQSLTPAKKGCRHMQALEESKKTSKRQPGTRGSSEGTSTIPGVPDESTIVSATSSEGTGTKPRVPDEENDITGENVILEWGSKQESEYSEEDKVDDEEKDDKDDDANDEGYYKSG